MSFFNRRRDIEKRNSNNVTPPASSDDEKNKKIEEETIAVTDQNGQSIRILKSVFLKEVLPKQIQDRWSDPDALYGLIIMSIQDGFVSEVVDAAEHLYQIDPIAERGSTTLAIVYLKMMRLKEAEQILLSYIEKNGETGIVMTNLSKVLYAQGKDENAEDTLWEGLQIDPNQDNGLPFWLSLQSQKNGPECTKDMLRKVAALPGSWLAHVYLAADELSHKNLAEAMSYYKQAILYAEGNTGVLYRISGDLGRFGYTSEAIELVSPLYVPGKDDIRTGCNLLQSYLKLGRTKEGLVLLEQMKHLNRPDLQEYLMDMEKKLSSGSVGEGKASIDPKDIKFTLTMFDKPVWYYGLGNPEWFLPLIKKEKKIGILTFSDISKKENNKVSAIREDESGRMTRTIPLFIAESLTFFSPMQPIVFLPVALGIGPVVSNKETENDQLQILSDRHSLDAMLVGSINIDAYKYNIKIRIYEKQAKKIREFETSSGSDDFGLRVRELLIRIHEYLRAPLPTQEDTLSGAYRLPSSAHLTEYLSALGQSLMQTLATNKLIETKSIWGEQNILNEFLRLTVSHPGDRVLEALFVSGLVKSKSYGSDAYKEYQKTAIAQLRSGEGSSPFLPVIYKAFKRYDELEQFDSSGIMADDPRYESWLTTLKSV